MNPLRVPSLSLALCLIAEVSAFSITPKSKQAPPPPPKPIAEFEPWISLCSLRPSTELQAALLARPADAGSPPWHALKLEAGSGPLLFDQRSLLITRMPLVENSAMTPAALLDHLRKNLSQFMAPAVSTLGPINEADKALWESEKPIGAVLSADIAGAGKVAFMLSDLMADSFTLSIIHPGTREYAAPSVIWQRRISVQEATPFEGCILSCKAVARASAENTSGEKVQAGLATAIWNAVLANAASFVQKNGGAVETTLLPAETTTAAWESVQAKFHQPKNNWLDIEGNWQSTDPGRRFRIEVKGWTGTCDFIERNARGLELRMTLPLRAEAGEKPGSLKFVIERPNTSKELLDYYSFPETIQTEILAQRPQPSTMVITRSGKKLNGDWSAISITRDSFGKHLKEFKQPSQIKAKPYPFADAASLPALPAPKPPGAANDRPVPPNALQQ